MYINRTNGCLQFRFDDDSFDTTVCIQVAEHVFTPLKLFEENVRVLKKGGFGIFMIPQTSNLHGTPHHYQNFTKFWCVEACRKNKVEMLKHYPLGGTWSTMASRLLYTPFQMISSPVFTYPKPREISFFTCYFLSQLFLYFCLSNYSNSFTW